MGFNLTFDPSRVSERQEFAPITPGEYTVVVDQVTEKISKKSGSNMLELKLKITGAQEEANKKFTGRLLFYYIIQDDQFVMDKIQNIFDSCQVQVPQNINGKTFVGLTGRVKTKLETYNGEPRASVNYWCRPRPGDQPSTPAPAPAAPKNSADDIPF